MEAGGSVLWLIAILVFFMWAMIFERIWYFSHGHEFYVKDLASEWNNRADKKSWHALQIREKMLSQAKACLLYTSPSPRDLQGSRMPSSA